MFSWYKYLIVSLVFSHLGFWSGSLFLIASFPDLCLLVLLYTFVEINVGRESIFRTFRNNFANSRINTLLGEGLSEPEFYGDLVYKFKKLIGMNDFSFQFRKIITRYRRIGYNLNVMRQPACLVFNPIMGDKNVAFFNCTPRLYNGPDLKLFHFSWLGLELLVCCLARGVQLVFFICSGFSK